MHFKNYVSIQLITIFHKFNKILLTLYKKDLFPFLSFNAIILNIHGNNKTINGTIKEKEKLDDTCIRR